MNKIVPFLSFVFLFAILNQSPVSAQGSVTSGNGYTVTIAIVPKAIVPSSYSCQYGYNYNVRLEYSVTFSGPNKPSSLYTLQGRLGCGSNSHFFDLPNGQSAGSVTSQSNVWRSVSDCGTASVSNLRCNVVAIEIEGPGITARTINFVVSNTPLPVELTSFTAAVTNNKVKLNWATATETNTDHFTVERSIDGNVWSAVKTVKAAGNSNEMRNYEAYDETPLKGTLQYRLKQVDIDGKTTNSSIRTVKYDNGAAVISVFPVPNSGNTINFSGITDPAHTLMIVQNMNGATIHSTTLKSSSTELPQLKPGMYIIRLSNTITGEVANLRYMKI